MQGKGIMELKDKKIDYWKLIAIAAFMLVLLVPAILMSIKLSSAESDNLGMGDYVEVIVIRNITNQTPIFSVNVTENIVQNADLNFKGNKTIEILPLVTTEPEPSSLPIIEENKTIQTQLQPSENGFLFYFVWFLIIVIIIIILGFGVYKGYSMYRETKDVPIKSYLAETISLEQKIKSELEKYKEKNESWDNYFRKALILIKKDAGEIKDEHKTKI